VALDMENGTKEIPEPRALSEDLRAVVKKLSGDAERLKKLSELQSLQQNRLEVSVDKTSVLEGAQGNHRETDLPADMKEMMDLLRLFTV
jgi:hypothetical protein